MKLIGRILAVLAAVGMVIASPAMAGADKPLVLEGAKIKQLPSATTLQLQAPTSGAASINLPHGTAPSSPNNGDCWTTTGGLYCRINGATVGPYATSGGGGGGGSGSWSLVATWTWSTNVSEVDFAGLAGANEILIVAEAIGMASSSVPVVQVSTNNGTSYFTGSSDYRRINQSGTVLSSSNLGSLWDANATAGRYGTFRVMFPNLTGVPRIGMAYPNDSSPVGEFLADNANDIDAIRLVSSSAGVNFTGGTIYVLTR